MPGTQAWSRWRFVIAPRWVAWHLFMVASVAGMMWLGDWQLHRALAGNSLSWAYTFEWPFFAILAVVFWAKTLRDEAYPPTAPQPAQVALPAGARRDPGDPPGNTAGDLAARDPGTAEEDAELAAYNAYLARLHEEVKGHGKWHGWR